MDKNWILEMLVIKTEIYKYSENQVSIKGHMVRSKRDSDTLNRL